MKVKKIIFTGGHHTSALAVAKELKKQSRQIFWLGQRQTMAGDRHLSLEYQEVIAAKIPFYNLLAGKMDRHGKLINWLKLPLGFIQALILILKIRPDLVVSFGGHLAVPVVSWAWLLKIPSVLHEQTTTAGRANRFLARMAKKILISWPSSKSFFPRKKTSLTGLPLRPEFVRAPLKKFFNNQLPTIYITGGKQGSHALNQLAAAVLPKLLADFNIIHQSGAARKTGDFQQLEGLSRQLSPTLQRRYYLQSFFSAREAGQAFRAADLVISRAGAHTVYELAWLKKPVILVPLPFSAGDEQLNNARYLVKAGLARIAPQADLNADKFLSLIKTFKPKNYRVKSDLVLINGLERVTAEINKVLDAAEKIQP